MKRLILLSLSVAFLSACSPRDPQLLTPEQKLSNMCAKNKTLPICQQQLQEKNKSTKPFVANDADLNFSVYSLDRQSEVLRWLKIALDFQVSQTQPSNKGCATLVSFQEEDQAFLKLSQSHCLAASNAGTSATSGDLIFNLKYNSKKELKEILLTSENRQITLTKKRWQQAAPGKTAQMGDATAVINEKILVKVRVTSTSLFIETLDILSTVNAKNTVGIDEVTQLHLTSSGAVQLSTINPGTDSKLQFVSQMPRLLLSYEAAFVSDAKARAFFTLALNNSKAGHVEFFEQGCAVRQLEYSVNYKFIDALSFDDGLLSLKNGSFELNVLAGKDKKPVKKTATETTCQPVTDADGNLSKAINWGRYLL